MPFFRAVIFDRSNHKMTFVKNAILVFLDDRTSASSHHGRTPNSPENNTATANMGGDLSPTSNQLARWFSPTLLEKARAGKLPNMPSTGLSQHALSLEEIERQTAAPVHN